MIRRPSFSKIASAAAFVLASTFSRLMPVLETGAQSLVRQVWWNRTHRIAARKHLIGQSKYRPHTGAKERLKFAGRRQFPEYLALEARNVATGKWRVA